MEIYRIDVKSRKEANNFLRKNNIDSKEIDLVKFYESYAKHYLVAGIALDTYELGSTIYIDLNDEDKKLGKKTIKTSIVIGGDATVAIP